MKHQEPIKISKELGHESNHHLEDGRHQNRPLVQKHLTRNKAIPFRVSTLAIGNGAKAHSTMMEEEERSECGGWNRVPPPSITSALFPRKEERVGTIVAG